MAPRCRMPPCSSHFSRDLTRATPTGFSKSVRASTFTTAATGRLRSRSGTSWRVSQESRYGNCWAGATTTTAPMHRPGSGWNRRCGWNVCWPGRTGAFAAAKIRFNHSDWREDVKVVEAAREAVGSGMALMVDANHGWRMAGDLRPRWDLATAQQCARALGDLDVFWLEEPLDTADIEGYAALRETSPVPIAAGEMVRSLSETRRLLDSVDVIQNDVVLAGGVIGCRIVAGWARERNRVWSPHTWSTGFGLLANLHVALAFSTAEFIEVPYDPPAWTPERRDFMLPQSIEIDREGNITVPGGPGLGVEPDLDALERYRVA